MPLDHFGGQVERVAHGEQATGPLVHLLAMAAFSVLWRTISMMRCSSPLIFSRSISAWRSCRLTARWPCGLVSCTLASTSAWRSKKPGVAAGIRRCRLR
jgi:hypothetical protein